MYMTKEGWWRGMVDKHRARREGMEGAPGA